ncbi:MAG: zinc ribbon domain-containing protein, partial [Actinomycetota bacterium]|nr:zinc ribbon domain-containing protein [Actinomycetota bacterium]
GPALLQGLVVCGRCGKRMTVGYHKRCNGTLVPDYACQGVGIAHGRSPCQNVCGAGVDAAVADLVLGELTPLAIEAAFEVAAELGRRAEDADRIRRAGVERAHQDAEAARRRYLAVDPTNRLVADTLEADWNAALRVLGEEQDAYERSRSQDAGALDEEQRARVRALARDLPALWNDPDTPMRERKRLMRLLVTDVTLIRGEEHITAHVRLSGGATRTLEVPRPLTAYELHTTAPATIALIEALLDDHPYDEVVGILNERRITGGWGKPFNVASLRALCRLRGIPDHRERLRAQGMLTLEEIAAQLGVSTQTIKIWQRRGDISGRRTDGRRECLYHPGQRRPPDGRTTRWQRNDRAVTPVGHDDNQDQGAISIGTSQGGAV